MRKGILEAVATGFALVIIAFGLAMPASAGARPAPDFDVTTLDGDTILLSDFHGTPVVLRFFTTWCVACGEDLATLEGFWSAGGGQVLAISLGEAEGVVRSYIRERGYGFPVALDPVGLVGSLYGILYIPTTVIVSAAGEVIHVQVGPMSAAELRGWMTAAGPEAPQGPDPVGAAVAFIAGLLSFFSPCVWPLYPGYLSMLAGRRGGALVGSLAFVTGFSAVFVGLGLAATALGGVLWAHQGLLTRGAGILILVFGLHQSGLMPIRFLLFERRVHLRAGAGGVGALAAGIGFGLGWSPCVGPVLGAILVYAGTSGTAWSGLFLLGAYSLGFGLPFVALAAGLGRLEGKMAPGGRWLQMVQRAGGFFLIALGIAVYMGWLTRLTAWLQGMF